MPLLSFKLHLGVYRKLGWMTSTAILEFITTYTTWMTSTAILEFITTCTTWMTTTAILEFITTCTTWMTTTDILEFIISCTTAALKPRTPPLAPAQPRRIIDFLPQQRFQRGPGVRVRAKHVRQDGTLRRWNVGSAYVHNGKTDLRDQVASFVAPQNR